MSEEYIADWVKRDAANMRARELARKILPISVGDLLLFESGGERIWVQVEPGIKLAAIAGGNSYLSVNGRNYNFCLVFDIDQLPRDETKIAYRYHDQWIMQYLMAKNNLEELINIACWDVMKATVLAEVGMERMRQKMMIVKALETKGEQIGYEVTRATGSRGESSVAGGSNADRPEEHV